MFLAKSAENAEEDDLVIPGFVADGKTVVVVGLMSDLQREGVKQNV